MTRYFWGPGDPRTIDRPSLPHQSRLDFPTLPDDAPPLLKKHTIYVRDPERILAVHTTSRQRDLQTLIRRYIYQLLNGCENPCCTTPTCWSCIERKTDPPPRRFTVLSARALAYTLATQENPEKDLCPHKQAITPELEDEAISQNKKLKQTKHDRREKRHEHKKKEKKSSKRHRVPSVEEREDGGKEAPGGSIPAPQSPSVEEQMSKAQEKGKGVTLEVRSKKAQKAESQSQLDPESITQNWFDTRSLRSLDTLYLSNDTRRLCDRFAPPNEESRYPKASSAYDAASSQKASNSKSKGAEEKEGKHHSKRMFHRSSIQTTGLPKLPTANPTETYQNGTISIKPDSKNSEPLQAKKSVRPRKTSIILKNAKDGPPNGVQELPDLPQTNDISVRKTGKTNGKEGHPLSQRKTEGLRDGQTDGLNGVQSDLPMYRPPETLSKLDSRIVITALEFLTSMDKITPEQRDFWSKSSYSSSSNPAKQSFRYERCAAFIDQSIHYTFGHFDTLLSCFRSQCRCAGRISERPVHYCAAEIDKALQPLMKVKSATVFNSLWLSLRSLFEPPADLVPKSPRLKAISVAKNTAKDNETRLKNDLNESSKPKYETDWNVFHAIVLSIHALAAFMPEATSSTWLRLIRMRSSGGTDLRQFDGSLSNGDIKSINFNKDTIHLTSTVLAFSDCFDDDLALRLGARLIRAIAAQIHYAELIRSRASASEMSQGELSAEKLADSIVEWLSHTVSRTVPNETGTLDRGWELPSLILGWAQILFIKHWDGQEEVARFGIAGSCLEIMRLFYDKRERLYLKEAQFFMGAISQRLEPLESPNEWFDAKPNQMTTHILSHSFLFRSEIVYTFFRCLNFTSMSTSSDSAISLVKQITTLQLLDPTRDDGGVARRMRRMVAKHFVMQIRRDNVLIDAMDQLWQREKSELLKPLKVLMGMDEGERGLDMGGVQQEFFRIALAKALDPDYGLFTTDSESKMYWFQPCSYEPLYKFELVGLLLGLATYNGITVPVTFPLALYRKLLGLPITSLAHIQDGWPALQKGFLDLLDWNESVEDVFCRSYAFSFPLAGRNYDVDISRIKAEDPWPIDETLILSNSQSREQPNGKLDNPNSSILNDKRKQRSRRFRNPYHPSSLTHWKDQAEPLPANELSTDDELSDDENAPLPSDEPPMVTNANRRPFIKSYIYWLTTKSISPQYNAFSRGFFSIVNQRSLSLFTPSALRTAIEGTHEIHVEDLRSSATYEPPMDAQAPLITTFWSVVESFSPDDLKKLLVFVTASDRVPIGGLRNIEFCIQRNGGDSEQLPSSYTCFGRLLLPEYESREKLERKLRVAIDNSEGFGII